MLSQLKSTYRPEQVVARDSRQSLTAGMLIERSRHLANELRNQDITMLALHGDNSLDWLVIDIACQMASICLVPLPSFFSAGQLKYIFNSIPIDAIISEHPDQFKQLITGRVEQLHHTAQYNLLVSGAEKPAPLIPHHTGKITFTSGSTGNPKGVCLSNEQLVKQALALANTVNIERPHHLCLLPLSTLLENVAGLYTPLFAGGEAIIPSLFEIGFEGSSSLNPHAMTKIISDNAPNTLILTPQLLVVLVTAAKSGWAPPGSLKFVAVGGGRVSHNLITEAQYLGIPAFEGYGLSECASVVSLNTVEHSNHNSCGRPLAHLNIEIENGEIIVSGNTMLGYAGEPDSWGKQRIYTGDLGFLDNEGFLFINGRKKNLLISSYGRNINPEWVESELLSHTLITECVVFGDAKPYCIALLSPNDPNESNKSIQKVINSINARLPDYARIKKWARLPQPLHSRQNLLTANGRPKRDRISAYYKALIKSLYPPELEVGNL